MKKDNKIIGSYLLGQNFQSNYYFHPRPSVSNYDGIHSFASNMGPTSKQLKNSIEKHSRLYRKTNNLPSGPIPIDGISYSSSSLDPHISIQNAMQQANRIALQRHIKKQEVIRLIQKHLKNTFPFQKKVINVLKINLELDELYPSPKINR